MRMISSILLVAALVTAGCASSKVSDTAPVPQPQIRVTLAGPIFFGSGTTAPATFDVTVTNVAKAPIRVREVELSSPEMSEYAIYPTRRIFNETIPAGETRRVTLFATAVTSISRLSPSEPLSIRAIVTMEAEGKPFRQVLFERSTASPQ